VNGHLRMAGAGSQGIDFNNFKIRKIFLCLITKNTVKSHLLVIMYVLGLPDENDL